MAAPRQQGVSAAIGLLPDSPPYGPALLSARGIRGLQCGSGLNLAQGWLNTDSMRLVDPRGTATAPYRLAEIGGACYMECDNAQPFPIEDGAFEWIYSEHFIEHIDLRAGVAWFREMRRLLKPGGLLRVSTPDLRRYVRGYVEPSSGFFRKHRQSLLEMGLKDVPERPAWMMNQLFMHWGHRWIYDLDEIRAAASAAGFPGDAVVECQYRQGRIPDVSALDRAVRSDESLYIEITH